MNQHAAIGHNNPPDPIDEAVEPFSSAIEEATNWLDGAPVENEDQMNAVDALLKDIREASTEVGKAKKAATDPLHKAWKAEIARWKPTEDDLDRIKRGLASLVDPFKRKLAEEKEAARRAAWEEARAKERAAEEAARAADASNIEAQRAADEAKREAIEANKAATETSRDKVKGLRTVTRWEITDYSAMLKWLNKNDRPALESFARDYARKCHKNGSSIDGLRVWNEREAF